MTASINHSFLNERIHNSFKNMQDACALDYIDMHYIPCAAGKALGEFFEEIQRALSENIDIDHANFLDKVNINKYELCNCINTALKVSYNEQNYDFLAISKNHSIPEQYQENIKKSIHSDLCQINKARRYFDKNVSLVDRECSSFKLSEFFKLHYNLENL